MSAPTTAVDIEFAADVRARDAALHEWLGDRTSYKLEEVPAHIHAPTNEERSQCEMIEFRATPLPVGQTYYAYLSIAYPKRITTFTGDTLADVLEITTRKVRANELTEERGSFWARGIDGRLYYGRHNDSGLYCTLRLARNQNQRRGSRS